MVFQQSTECAAAHIWVFLLLIFFFHIFHHLMMFPGFSCVMSQLIHLAQKHNTLLSASAVLSNCLTFYALPMISEIPSRSCHVLASLDSVAIFSIAIFLGHCFPRGKGAWGYPCVKHQLRGNNTKDSHTTRKLHALLFSNSVWVL